MNALDHLYVTPKGLERLRDQLVNQQSLALVDGGAP